MLLTQIHQLVRSAVLLAVLTVLLFGISSFGLGMGTMSPTANCPFGGHSMSICKMNPMEHIQEWQSMFTTLPAKDSLTLLSLLLVLFVLLKLRQVFSVPKIPKTDSYINLFYIHRPPIFNPFKEAFSSGILNPKIF